MKEDKQAICNALCEALKLTKAFRGIERIDYNADSEKAIVVFDEYDRVEINVAMDSGAAMIRDILRGLT
jgi:hypothetical protein